MNIPLSLITKCIVAGVSPLTVQKIISVESKGNPLAVNINHSNISIPIANNLEKSIESASQLIKKGYSVDLGLMQINSNNFGKYKLSLKEAFDSCKNINIGSQILKESFERAEVRLKSRGQNTLMAALSAYNTGNFHSGFNNGYLKKYYANIKEDPKELKTIPLNRGTLDLAQTALVDFWLAKPIHNPEFKSNGSIESQFVTPMRTPASLFTHDVGPL
jgi:type IV secretion system protein VirB1